MTNQEWTTAAHRDAPKGKYDHYAGAAPEGGGRKEQHSGDAPISRYVGQRGANGSETPRSVKWVLSHAKLVSHRFTPVQWVLLNWTWRSWTGYQRLGRAMDMTAQQVQRAVREAERIAYELYYLWYPALQRWQNGVKPREGDHALLAKHKHHKKGRRDIPQGVRSMGTSAESRDHLEYRDYETHDEGNPEEEELKELTGDE